MNKYCIISVYFGFKLKCNARITACTTYILFAIVHTLKSCFISKILSSLSATVKIKILPKVQQIMMKSEI